MTDLSKTSVNPSNRTSFLSTDTLRARWKYCEFPNKTAKMSACLNWMIIRNNHAFLVKKRNIKKPFSKEPNNVTNLNSFRYNGLVQKKAVGVVENPDRKGFTVVYKKAKAANKPVKHIVRRTFKAGARRSLYKVKRLLRANHYRTDLSKATLRRASAILRSQRPIKAKKPKAAAPKAE